MIKMMIITAKMTLTTITAIFNYTEKSEFVKVGEK